MYFLTRHDCIELIYQSLTGILLLLVFDINQRVENPLKDLLSILLPGPKSVFCFTLPATKIKIRSRVRLIFDRLLRSFGVLFCFSLDSAHHLHPFLKERDVRIV